MDKDGRTASEVPIAVISWDDLSIYLRYSSTQIGKKLVTIELDLIGIQLEWDFKNLLLQWISLLISSMWNLNLISDPSSTN